jgi:protein-disulfide isomerase
MVGFWTRPGAMRAGRALLAGLGLAACLSLALPHAAIADSFTPQQREEIVNIVRSALKADPSILRDALASMQTNEAQAQQAAIRAEISRSEPALNHTAGDPSTGNPNGDVAVVEFYDVRCPYCRRMLPVLAALLKQDPGVKLVFKDIPILGPGSVLGARAVLAAQAQGGYLRLHDALMTGPAEITIDTVKDAARKTGLDWNRLQRDMADPAIMARIDANLKLASQLQIDGTPAYVIGKRLLPGAVDIAELQSAVTAARAR